MKASGIAGRAAADAALTQLHLVETIEQAYEAWTELKLQHAAMRARSSEELRKVEQQGSFLVGAVRAAAQAPDGAGEGTAALTKPGTDPLPLDAFLGEAEERLARARSDLQAGLREEESHFADAFAKIQDEVLQRVQRTLEKVRPLVRVRLRSIGQSRTMLHVDRVRPDDAVLLLNVLSGRIPSRYGYLFDDSTDDVALAPPPLYPDEGIDASQTRPSAEALRELARSERKVLPAKGFIPVFVANPSAAGGEDFFRLLQRGPVMEVELQEGAQFRNLLSREEGERFAGHLLRLKLQGRIELEVVAD
jgi:hypothetical protein